ncbi:MAG: hypothetical protein JSW47_13965 [Phycisphaerales bacterium]|nr:MAG: hypothetical protein JSW47_13965 [Phycisphaerales bacterium]
MATGSEDHPKPKLGAEFRLRLSQAEPDDRIRAVIVLNIAPPTAARAGRLSREAKERTARRMKEVATELLPEIDSVLRDYHGKRLTEDVDVLGTISVEAPAAGLLAVARCDTVRAVLEDQDISLLSFQPKEDSGN